MVEGAVPGFRRTASIGKHLRQLFDAVASQGGDCVIVTVCDVDDASIGQIAKIADDRVQEPQCSPSISVTWPRVMAAIRRPQRKSQNALGSRDRGKLHCMPNRVATPKTRRASLGGARPFSFKLRCPDDQDQKLRWKRKTPAH